MDPRARWACGAPAAQPVETSASHILGDPDFPAKSGRRSLAHGTVGLAPSRSTDPLKREELR